MLLKSFKKFSLLFLFISFFSFSEYKGIVTPLPNEKYGTNVLNFIKNAEKSIYLIMFQTGYYPKYGESISNQILREIINANKRGVKVEVILELTKLKDVREKNFETAKFLAENGIKVYFDSENKTTHSKLLIIDGKYVFIGSHNWNYYSLEKNNETSVLIESEEIANFFIQYFNQLKKECRIFISPLGGTGLGAYARFFLYFPIEKCGLRSPSDIVIAPIRRNYLKHVSFQVLQSQFPTFFIFPT
ncbi:MAG: phospholipase D-like domain-containing protein [Candidatus Ratteibacteria bacterium]